MGGSPEADGDPGTGGSSEAALARDPEPGSGREREPGAAAGPAAPARPDAGPAPGPGPGAGRRPGTAIPGAAGPGPADRTRGPGAAEPGAGRPGARAARLLAHRPLLRRGLATQLGVPGAESAAVGPAAVGPDVRALALLGGGVEGGDVEQRGAHERVSEHGAEGLVVLPADVRGRPAGGGPGVDIVHEAALVGHAPSIPHARALCSAPPPAEDRPARVRRGGRDRFRSPARGGATSGMPRRTIDTPTP